MGTLVHFSKVHFWLATLYHLVNMCSETHTSTYTHIHIQDLNESLWKHAVCIVLGFLFCISSSPPPYLWRKCYIFFNGSFRTILKTVNHWTGTNKSFCGMFRPFFPEQSLLKRNGVEHRKTHQIREEGNKWITRLWSLRIGRGLYPGSQWHTNQDYFPNISHGANGA